MSAPVIEFEDASFTYAGADEASVQKVSLTIEAGECVVLCGRSGCGKTTLTRLANGLAGGFWEGRRTGAVRVEGRNVDELEEWRLAEHIGSVFQNPRTQFFNLDTTGEIAFALENLGVPRDEMHARAGGRRPSGRGGNPRSRTARRGMRSNYHAWMTCADALHQERPEPASRKDIAHGSKR